MGRMDPHRILYRIHHIYSDINVKEKKTMKGFTQEELELCETITFRNIINWRKEELLRILDGEKAIDVIPQSNQRRKLNRDGVLVTHYQMAGRIISLTPRAKLMLEATK